METPPGENQRRSQDKRGTAAPAERGSPGSFHCLPTGLGGSRPGVHHTTLKGRNRVELLVNPSPHRDGCFCVFRGQVVFWGVTTENVTGCVVGEICMRYIRGEICVRYILGEIYVCVTF